MNNKWVQKGISLLVKLGLLTLAIIFLFQKLDMESLKEVFSKPLYLPELIIPVFILLWLFNIYIDAFFWMHVHRMLEKVGILRGLKINLICYALAFITPANSGEWAGRYVMMGEPENRKKSFFLNFWMHLPRLFSKLILTSISAGILCYYFSILNIAYSVLLSFALLGILGFVYFSFKRFQKWLHLKQIGRFKMENYMLEGRPTIKEKAKFLLLASAKFLAYNIQFGLVLLLFSQEGISWHVWLAIPVYYLIGSLLPTFAFADFILKSAIAIWVFQPVMENEALLILASIAIWLFNVVFPSFIGLYVILKTNLFKSFKKKFSRGILNGL